MVGLDLTDIDESVLKYTKLLSDIIHPKYIEFVHIVHKLSDAVHIHLPNNLNYPSSDDLLEEMEKIVFKYFTGNDPITCEILEGSVKFDLWRESYLKDIDLFIAGSKEKHLGRGMIPKKFVRKSFCSVLFVPAEIPKGISKIWMPVDFSEPSGEAFDQALHLAQEADPPAEICAHHIYEMPHAYYYEGFPRDEIMRAIREEAEKKYQEFNKQYNLHNLPTTPFFTALRKSYAADHLKMDAEKQQADLIMIASGGRSRFSKFFLGSETEQLVQKEKQIPLLILKNKSEQVRLWDLLNP